MLNSKPIETITAKKTGLNCAEPSICKVRKYGKNAWFTLAGTINATSSGYGDIFSGLPKPVGNVWFYVFAGNYQFPLLLNDQGVLAKGVDSSTQSGWYIGTATYFTND